MVFEVEMMIKAAHFEPMKLVKESTSLSILIE